MTGGVVLFVCFVIYCWCRTTFIDFLSWSYVVSSSSLRYISRVFVSYRYISSLLFWNRGGDEGDCPSRTLVLPEERRFFSICFLGVVGSGGGTCGCQKWWHLKTSGVSMTRVDSLNKSQVCRHKWGSFLGCGGSRRHRVGRWHDVVELSSRRDPHVGRDIRLSMTWEGRDSKTIVTWYGQTTGR